MECLVPTKIQKYLSLQTETEKLKLLKQPLCKEQILGKITRLRFVLRRMVSEYTQSNGKPRKVTKRLPNKPAKKILVCSISHTTYFKRSEKLQFYRDVYDMILDEEYVHTINYYAIFKILGKNIPIGPFTTKKLAEAKRNLLIRQWDLINKGERPKEYVRLWIKKNFPPNKNQIRKENTDGNV